MATILFNKIITSVKGMVSTAQGKPVSDKYPWLFMHAKYGTGFRLSNAYADMGDGYGSMPDITSGMSLDQSTVKTVRQHYSWVAILDKCIGQFGSARKELIEEFADCTGNSDIVWWVAIENPEQWLSDMEKTVQALSVALQSGG